MFLAVRLPCNIEILSVGNELLLGNTVNTSASWIAKQVTKLGGKVTRVTTVADNLEEISRAVREGTRRRPDFLITTGGIGPTFDDMTLKAVARALRAPLRLNRAALKMVRVHYARRFPKRRISLTKPRLKMAIIPSGSLPLYNPVGTAPGVRMPAGNTAIFCLPGVPREAKAIFGDSVSKFIVERSGGVKFAEKWVKVHGAMESVLAPIIDRVMRRWPGVYIKSHPRSGEGRGRPFIELHLSISSSKPRRAEQSLLGAFEEIVKHLADLGANVRSVK